MEKNLSSKGIGIFLLKDNKSDKLAYKNRVDS
jgi:hypothetical protein